MAFSGGASAVLLVLFGVVFFVWKGGGGTSALFFFFLVFGKGEPSLPLIVFCAVALCGWGTTVQYQ